MIEAWSELTFRHAAGLEQHGENSSKPKKPLVARLSACAGMDKVQIIWTLSIRDAGSVHTRGHSARWHDCARGGPREASERAIPSVASSATVGERDSSQQFGDVAWSELTFPHVAGLGQPIEKSSEPRKPLVARLSACAEMDKVQIMWSNTAPRLACRGWAGRSIDLSPGHPSACIFRQRPLHHAARGFCENCQRPWDENIAV